MAAPTILAELQTTPSTTNSTSYPVTVPTGAAGEPVECKVTSTSNGDLSTTSTGWHLVRQWKFTSALSVAIFRKELGTTGADSLTITSSTSARFAALTQRLTVGTRLYAGTASATATGTNSNPPLVDHLRSRECLYEAVRAGAGSVVPTVTPSGYGALVNNAGTSGGASLTIARKTATSSSEDPGPFTSASALWGCITIAHWIDTTGPTMALTRALLAAASTDVIILAMGDSQEAGAVAIPGPADTMGSNVSSVCRNAVRAAALQAMPGSRGSIMASGGLTTTAEVKAWDTRLTADASFALSGAIGAYTLGGQAWTLGTAGHQIHLAMGVAFDRVEVTYFHNSGSPQWTVDVNGGTPQTITGMTNAADGIGTTTFNLSGNSAAVINLTAPGPGGYVLKVRVWSTTEKRVHFINGGWYGATSTQLADAGAYFSSARAQAAIGAHATFFTGGSNDTTAGIPFATTLDNLRLNILIGLSTGEFCYTIPNYFSGGTEAAQDASWDLVVAMCSELGAAVNRLTLKSGFTTSYAATVAAGNLINGNNHMTVQGHTVAGGHDLAMIDPGPAAVHDGTGSVEAVIALASQGVRAASGAGSLAASAAVSPSGAKSAYATAAIAAEAAPTSNGSKAGHGSGALAADVASTATGAQISAGSGAVAAEAGVAVQGAKQGQGGAALAATTGTAAAGLRSADGAVALDALAAVSAQGEKHATGAGSVGAVGALTASGGIDEAYSGTGATEAICGLATAGEAHRAGTGNQEAAADIAAAGAKAASGQAATSAVASLSGSAVLVENYSGSGSTSAVSAATSSGAKAASGNVALELVHDAATTGSKGAGAVTSIGASVAVSAQGRRGSSGRASLTARAGLTGHYTARRAGSGQIDAVAAVASQRIPTNPLRRVLLSGRIERRLTLAGVITRTIRL